MSRTFLLAAFLGLAVLGCDEPETNDGGAGRDDAAAETRADGARRLTTAASGSDQNPAWSPDGASILYTHFRDGYNAGAADLLVLDLSGGGVASRVSADDGSSNVNLPGSLTTWTEGGLVIFSADREPADRDEAYVVDLSGTITQVTRTDGLNGRPDGRVFEPSISPDGQWLVFEVHPLTEGDTPGVLYVAPVNGDLDSKNYLPITSAGDDARQPVWSPDGQRIVFQRGDGTPMPDTRWDLWMVDATDPASMSPTTSRTNVTATADESETDASFSPSGDWIVFSKEPPEADSVASIYVVAAEASATPTRVTLSSGYDGAPGWSTDGTRIAFETYPGDPDDGPGSALFVIDAPVAGVDQ